MQPQRDWFNGSRTSRSTMFGRFVYKEVMQLLLDPGLVLEQRWDYDRRSEYWPSTAHPQRNWSRSSHQEVPGATRKTRQCHGLSSRRGGLHTAALSATTRPQ